MVREEIKRGIERYLKIKYAKRIEDAEDFEIFNALSLTIMEEIIDKWNDTKELYENGKQAFYLSAEYLMGRALGNNLISTGLYEDVKTVLEELNIDINKIEEIEEDAGLGNGGLGRLAACFMDSAATMEVPLTGYGIRYSNGLFSQYIENGVQKETGDFWLKYGDPWSIRKDCETVIINYKDMKVKAVPYDTPIIGYGNKNINTLRLWSAEPVSNEFDYSSFSRGEFLKAISYKNSVEAISLVLYPEDSFYEGKMLRLKQQYFFVCAGLQSIIRRFKRIGGDIYELDEKIAIHINDTHPTLAIPELMRLLVDEEGMDWNTAWRITQNTISYTNHTILAEALEKWPLAYLDEVVPHLVVIIKKLDKLVRAEYKDPAVQIIDKQKRVHMAHMDIHFSNSVNGVAALHTEILKNSELKAFYALYPEKFNNKTNGITFRRWLEFSNQALAAYIKELIGDEYLHDATKLEKLLAFKDDKKVHQQLAKIKFENKLALKAYLKENKGIELDENSIIDTQIKRFHEYKRQQMNALYVIHKYLEIKAGKLPKRKITVIFGGKAAPAYVIAQDIIHLILCLSELINNDPKVNKYLNVHLVENYNVSVAEKLIPATDISEQISLASKEASGTGNMKFMLNGALTLGTMDGANVESAELAGAENIYTFGKDSESIIKLYETAGYVSKAYYENDKDIKRAVDFILNPAVVKLGNKIRLERLYNELLNKDWFMTLIDFNAYVEAKEQILADYEDQDSWNEKVVHNIAKAGFFSSDRTIAQYNADIWHCEG